MKIITPRKYLLLLIALCFCIGKAHSQTFSPVSAGDFGASHPNYPASNTIDGNTNFSSRWAANFNDGGGDVNLFVDLGSVKRVDDIGVAWGRGDQISMLAKYVSRYFQTATAPIMPMSQNLKSMALQAHRAVTLAVAVRAAAVLVAVQIMITIRAAA